MGTKVMTRPTLGQRVRAKDRLIRASHPNGSQEWLPEGVRWVSSTPTPVDGIYIGYRTYYNGRRDWTGDDWAFIPTDHFEVWLIVENERQNPAPVLPEDVEVLGK